MTTSSAPHVPEPARRFPAAWSKAARSQSLPSPPFRRAAKNDVVDGVHDVVATPGRPISRVVAQSLRVTADAELNEVVRTGAACADAPKISENAAAAAASAGRGLMKAGNVRNAPIWRVSTLQIRRRRPNSESMSRFAALRDALPQGRTLPDDVWLRRHRWMLNLLWAHAVVLPLIGLLRGYGIAHTLGHAVPMVACGLAANHYSDRRRGAAVLVSIGLLTASAELVHIFDGLIETHFHFFVMISVLTMYEDWLPFLVAVGYVGLHHGVYGALEPHSVYDHPGNPFAFAGIHAAFVLAAGAANVLSWRLNEDVRGELREAYEDTRLVLDTAHEAFIGLDEHGVIVAWNLEAAELFGYPREEAIGRLWTDTIVPPQHADEHREG